MDDEPEFLGALERTLVDGARHHVARMRRRRRVAVASASLSLLALGSIGVIAVQGDDGSSDDLGAALTLPDAAPSATSSASTQPDRVRTSTIPIPESTPTTTATSSTTTTASTALTTTTPTVSTPPGLPCDPVDGDDQFPLRRCDRGWGVVWVRNALVEWGDFVETDDDPSIFTDEVEAAVRRFQQSNGLEVDGLVGPQTWFALYPEFLDAGGDLAQFDLDGDGRIGPYEVASMGDANSQCDVPTADDCPTTTAEP